MSTNKDNYEFYRNTFNKVHASDELVRKVKTMAEVKTKNKIYNIRRAFGVAIAAALIFAASNVAVYAATGKSWVEKIAVDVMFNGEKKEMELDKITDENGNVHYEMDLELEEEDGTIYTFPLTFDESQDIESMELITYKPTLVEENDKIYLVEDNLKVKEDITEDFADGEATVNVIAEDGQEFVVTVEGTIDSNNISVYPVDIDEEYIIE